MNPVIVLKLLDLAFLGISAWERHEEMSRNVPGTANRINDLRRQILSGELSDDAAMREIDAITDAIIARRKSAISRLPVYAVSEFDGE